jgi:hypothetical protein
MTADELEILERAARTLGIVSAALENDPGRPVNALATLQYLETSGITPRRLDNLAADVRGLMHRERRPGPAERKTARGEAAARHLEPRRD